MQVAYFETTNTILAVRDPMTRLYSAWQDKSRTFRFQNGSVDWELAQKSTTWIWVTANDTEGQKMMEDILRKHDIYFNPKRFGIDKFEEMIEFNIKLCELFLQNLIIIEIKPQEPLHSNFFM